MKLPREFYLRDGLTVARELIGKKLVTNLPEGVTSGIIVETEAYMGKIDAAAHSYKGLTERTKIFYGAGGFVYVYLIYGRNICTNVVAFIEDGEKLPVLTTPRINVDYAGAAADYPWRFIAANSKFLSKHA